MKGRLYGAETSLIFDHTPDWHHADYGDVFVSHPAHTHYLVREAKKVNRSVSPYRYKYKVVKVDPGIITFSTDARFIEFVWVPRSKKWLHTQGASTSRVIYQLSF